MNHRAEMFEDVVLGAIIQKIAGRERSIIAFGPFTSKPNQPPRVCKRQRA